MGKVYTKIAVTFPKKVLEIFPENANFSNILGQMYKNNIPGNAKINEKKDKIKKLLKFNSFK